MGVNKDAIRDEEDDFTSGHLCRFSHELFQSGVAGFCNYHALLNNTACPLAHLKLSVVKVERGIFSEQCADEYLRHLLIVAVNEQRLILGHGWKLTVVRRQVAVVLETLDGCAHDNLVGGELLQKSYLAAVEATTTKSSGSTSLSIKRAIKSFVRL